MGQILPGRGECEDSLQPSRAAGHGQRKQAGYESGPIFFTLVWRGSAGSTTIFGTVAGDRVFNLLRMGEVETDDFDRPVDGHNTQSGRGLAQPPFDGGG